MLSLKIFLGVLNDVLTVSWICC